MSSFKVHLITINIINGYQEQHGTPITTCIVINAYMCEMHKGTRRLKNVKTFLLGISAIPTPPPRRVSASLCSQFALRPIMRYKRRKSPVAKVFVMRSASVDYLETCVGIMSFIRLVFQKIVSYVDVLRSLRRGFGPSLRNSSLIVHVYWHRLRCGAANLL
jgi:hypothetical protein